MSLSTLKEKRERKHIICPECRRNLEQDLKKEKPRRRFRCHDVDAEQETIPQEIDITKYAIYNEKKNCPDFHLYK